MRSAADRCHATRRPDPADDVRGASRRCRAIGSYRDGMLLLSKSAGKGHWETHPEDELLYVFDGAMTVDVAKTDRPQSFTVSTGMKR